MYFHLIWIKEKNWEKYDLDLLLQWWDEDFIRKFLANRWVVIVSITEYKDDPESFWNIVISVVYNNANIQIRIQWSDLAETMHFIVNLWITPDSVNFVSNPVPEEQMKDMLNSTIAKINEENERIKKEAEEAELKEQKKYEESWIKSWLDIINHNIDHIEQVIKAWEWLITWNELKELDTYLNEMKKIRLWTNFNKMASLVLESHRSVKNAEKVILDKYSDCRFPIDKNSIVSNIDILEDYFSLSRISDRGKLQSNSLKPSESVTNLLWPSAIFLSLLKRDISHTIAVSNLEEVFDVTINLIEYIILTSIEAVSIMWMLTLCFWIGNFSPYLLPALWWLWLLVYLFNNLKFGSCIFKEYTSPQPTNIILSVRALVSGPLSFATIFQSFGFWDLTYNILVTLLSSYS